MFLVTLIYADGTRWFAGGFSTSDQAWIWIDEEKTRTYWLEATEIEVINATPPEEPYPDGFFGMPDETEETPAPPEEA